MKRDPNDLQRYTASERANHWVVGICFILLALSGLSLFHPALFPLSSLFGGGTWTRILHPWIGVVMMLFFLVMFLRFAGKNLMGGKDWEWVSRVGEMVDGNDHGMPEMGKYNGGQKLLFWLLGLCMVLLFLSGLALWREYFAGALAVDTVRLAAVAHAAMATIMIIAIVIHVYAAIWVKGTIRAMLYGTVTRAWAKQHHRAWYREVTGK
ncbi:MAG: formate dehydrogenase subunit gamma [Rhodocyclaceae bacterium]|nr:formate dehydrogenase subunit gamma [Rhodocyclaceae bacterium]